MKLAAVILVLAVLAPQTLALTPLEASVMRADVTISNRVDFEKTGSRYDLAEASARLTWYPRDDYLQDVDSIEITPDATQTSGGIFFEWPSPGASETFTLKSSITTYNRVVPIREKIPFPLTDVPEDLSLYLAEGEITDQTRDIQRLAQELVRGKDDAYDAVFTLADWTTTNIEYSLASLGQPAIQKASEVLESGQGKCDELTALFISMNRAVGIPARFAAGYSYTNSPLFEREWGGHGWAEVWLPDVGWVPFDVTYGEYGYLDAGHVKLKTSPDAKETSIDYFATGTDFRIETAPLDIRITPVEMRAHTDRTISISLDAPYREVGFGSVVLILATVRNLEDHYVSTRLDLARTSSTEMLSATYENIFLPPNGQEVIPFLVRIDQDLKEGYRYDFPFTLTSRLGDEEEIRIEVNERAPRYAEDAYSQHLMGAQDEGESSLFGVTCIQQGLVYAGESVMHVCSIEGLDVDTIMVCGEECAAYPVRGDVFTIEHVPDHGGIATKAYVARFGGDDVQFFVRSRSIGKTELSINLSAPDTLTPEESALIRIGLDHTGGLPRDIHVTVDAPDGRAEQRLSDLSRPAELRFTLPGMTLRPGQNDIGITITYEDELGRVHAQNRIVVISLEDVRILHRLEFWTKDAWYFLSGFFG